jgi:acetoin:2,6-dichlorophenolindophenol oxidoreductase subunit alpha
MTEIVRYCREGKGPAAVEFDTERFYGHFEGDPQRYRGSGEVDRLRATRDSIKSFRDKALSSRAVAASVLDQVDREVLELIDSAVKEARAAPTPEAADVDTDVYVTY